MVAKPKPTGPKDGGTYAARAAARWQTPPDWVKALADAADRATSQGELGKRLGIDASAISGVIGRTYPGKLETIEARVRGVLMNAGVACPMLGTVPRDKCLDHQARPFTCSNPALAQLWRACRNNCPNAMPSALKQGDKKC